MRNILDDREVAQKGLTRTQKIWLASRIIRIVMRFVVLIGICCLLVVLTPYISGEEEFEELPLTLSQLESVIVVCGVLYMWRKAKI